MPVMSITLPFAYFSFCAHPPKILVIKCYSSWLTLGVVPLGNVQNSGIMHLALNILAQHSTPTSLHDAASDCVTSLLARLEREVPYLPYLNCCVLVVKYGT